MTSYADRALNGPLITWMIQHKVSFLFASAHPYALGGLIGGVFFTGYMLTQFPGGYFGDRFGHQRMIALSLLWAGLVTLVSGLAASLILFVLLRVLVGLGEGMYYANDRSVISEVTPFEKRSMGLSVAIVGLPVGATLTNLCLPFLLNWGEAWFGPNQGWRMPLFIFGICTLIVATFVHRHFQRSQSPKASYRTALWGVSRYTIVFLVFIMVIFVLGDHLGISSWITAVIELVLALALIGFIYRSKGQELVSILRNRDLLLLFIAWISPIWNLWFMGFWSVSVISEAAHTSFLIAALTIAFNGIAGIFATPFGGWLADYTVRRNLGRKFIVQWFMLIQGLLTLFFSIYLSSGGKSAVVMGLILFVANLFSNAYQAAAHALISDLTVLNERGSAFGMFNLISEIGAVLAPAISGTMRDATGSWIPASYLDAILLICSAALVFLIRERAKSHATGASLTL
ncbi:MAG: MFS transporter [Alicyclobacillus sp.]|nr:MFS transporter [Alicyclobacillus sp.]